MLLIYAYILDIHDGSIYKMIPLNNCNKHVPPYTIQKDHRYEAGRDDRGLDISAFAQDGCKVSCIRQNTKVALASLAYADMASEHSQPKGKARVT